MSGYQHYWNRYLKVPESCIIEFIKQVGNKRQNVRLAEHFIAFFATSLINSILQEHVYHMMLNYFQIAFFSLNMK